MKLGVKSETVGRFQGDLAVGGFMHVSRSPQSSLLKRGRASGPLLTRSYASLSDASCRLSAPYCWSQLLAKKGSDRHSVIALFRRLPSGVALAVLIVRERGPGL